MSRAILVCLIVIAACSKSTPEKPPVGREMIARINSDTIFADDFKAFVAAQKGRTIDVSKKSHRDLLLDELVEKRLIQRFGYDLKYDTLTDVRKRVRDRESEMLYEKFLRHAVIQPVLTRGDIEATYDKIKIERRISQIFVGHSQITSRMSVEHVMKTSRSRDEAKRLADSIHRAVVAEPKKFADLAAAYSTDESGQYSGGDLGYLRLDQIEPLFQPAIGTVKKGEVGAPVEDASGFHIFYVTDERPSEAFRSLDEHLQYVTDITANSLLRRPNDDVRKRYQVVEDSLFARRHVRFQSAAIQTFLSRYQKIDRPSEMTAAFDSLELNLSLATFDGGDVKIKEIVAQMADNTNRVALDEKRMQEGLRRVCRTRLFGDAARDMGLELTKQEIADVSAFEASEVVTFAISHHIFSPVRFDDTDLRNHYQANRTRFEALDQVRIKEIASRDKEKITAYRTEIQRSNNFDVVYERAKTDSAMTCKEWPMLQDDKTNERISYANRNLEIGQTSDVLTLGSDEFYIIKLVDKIEGTLLPFESVKTLVVQDYVDQTRERLRHEWISGLWKQYDVEVRKDLLDDIYDLRLK
jgi:parvulin-like peptidyl-prolyl isomerase